MPIYDYKCLECDKVSEIFLCGAKSQLIHCPDCGSDNISSYPKY